MEQLQSILTDLDNKAITKHQAYDLILVLFDVVGRSEQLKAFFDYLDSLSEKEYDAKSITEHGNDWIKNL